MISKNLNTLDGQLKITIPSKLEEITLGMLIQMQDDNTLLETVSILSGMPKEELYNVRNINDFELFGEHIASLSHQILYESDKLTMPKSIFICGKKIDVISNLSIEPAGAFMECRNLIADEINEHIKQFGEDDWKKNFRPSLKTTALILANYLYCPTTGNHFDDEKAEAFQSEILKLSVALTIPIARHFFLSYPNLWTEKQSYSKRLILTWKRKLASRNSRRSAILILLTLSLMAI